MEKQPVAWKEYGVEYWCAQTRKRMSRGNGCRDTTEKLLKTALNPNQSILLHRFVTLPNSFIHELVLKAVCMHQNDVINVAQM